MVLTSKNYSKNSMYYGKVTNYFNKISLKYWFLPYRNIFDYYQLFFILLSIFVRLVLMDIILIISCIIMMNWKNEFFIHNLQWIITFFLSYFTFKLFYFLLNISNTIFLGIEKEIISNFPNNYNNYQVFSSPEFYSMDFSYSLETGFLYIINLLLCPIRLFLFGYLLFNEFWVSLKVILILILVIIVSSIFEYIKLKFSILPEKIYLINEINYFIDNFKTFFLLQNHQDLFFDKFKRTFNLKYIIEYLTYHMFNLIKYFFILYSSLNIVNYLIDNSQDQYQILLKHNINYFSLKLWLSLYLICSIRFVGPIVNFLVSYKQIIELCKYFKKEQIQEFHFKKNDCLNVPEKSKNKTLNFNLKVKRLINLISEMLFPNYVSYIDQFKDSLPSKIFENQLMLISDAEVDEMSDLRDFKNNHMDINLEISILNQTNNTVDLLNFAKLKLSYFKSCRNDEINYISQIKKFLLNITFLFYKKEAVEFIKDVDQYSIRNNYQNISENSVLELENINLSIQKSELVVILGDLSGKSLLSKYLSGFPGIVCNEKVTNDHLEIIKKPQIYLLNRKMLDLISYICEDNLDFDFDLLDFVTCGKTFDKNLFRLVTESFMLEKYFKFDETSLKVSEIRKEDLAMIKPIFNIRNTQEFVEAKIFLQLSQMFYSILLDKCNLGSIIILDDIFNLLIPFKSLKIMKNLVSKFKDYKLSFIITVNEDLEPFLSCLANEQNCKIRLLFIDKRGLSDFSFSLRNNYELNKEKFLYLNLSADNEINKILSIESNYEINSNLFSSKKNNFERLKIKKFLKKKYIVLIYLLGFMILFFKFSIFKNFFKNDFCKTSDFTQLFLFQILTFSSSISTINLTSNTGINEMGNFLLFYMTIYSLFLNGNKIDSFNSTNDIKLNFKIDNAEYFKEKLFGFWQNSLDKNFSSSNFILYDGEQILKNSSLFYKKYFREKQLVSIPRIEPIGFKNALIISEFVENSLQKKANIKLNDDLKNKVIMDYSSTFNLNLSFKLVAIFSIFYLIEIILKYIILIIVSFKELNGIRFFNCNYFEYLLMLVKYSENPIFFMNDIYIKKRIFLFRLFNEIYTEKQFTINYYLNRIRNMNLLLIMIYMASNNYSLKVDFTSIIFNTLFSILIINILDKFKKFFIKNSKFQIYSKKPVLICDSYDLFYYLKMNNISAWFKNKIIQSLKVKFDILQSKNTYIQRIQVASLFSSLLIYLIILILSCIKNCQHLNYQLIFAFPLLLLVSHSTSIQGSDNSKPGKEYFETNFKYLIKRLKKFFSFRTNYISLKTNIYSVNESFKETYSNSSNSESLFSNDFELQFSSPTSKSSLKNKNFIHLVNEFLEINNKMLYLVNSSTLIEKSIIFESNYSRLFFWDFLRMKANTFSLSEVVVISGYNYLNFDWSLKKILDPKNLFFTNQLLNVLKITNLLPNNFKNSSKNLFNLSIIDFYKFYKLNCKFINKNIEFGYINEHSNTKYFNFENEFQCLTKFSNTSSEKLLSYSNFQKLVLLGHCILYSEYYETLILHLNISMESNKWLELIVNYIIDQRSSSIKNIIVLSSDKNIQEIKIRKQIN